MRMHVISILAAALLTAVAGGLIPAVCNAGELSNRTEYREVIEAEKLNIDNKFRIREGFSESKYYGLIRSQDELEDIWSGLINIDKPYTSRMGIGLPDPPEVDFDTYSVIWFSDRGAGAGFVDSILVAGYKTDMKLYVTIVVDHSDSGSDRLNLWKVPVTGYRAEFNVLHKYEEKGP